jgi:nitroreductase
MKDIIQQLEWRYAVKKFDSSKKLSSKQVEKLKKAITLSASSMGLQPYKVLVISDEATKAKLFPLSYNQDQIVSSSHLFLFCAVNEINDAYADKFIELTAEIQQVDKSTLAPYASMVKGFVKNFSSEQKIVWASKQTYIALGTLLTTCALEEIDACPMEGFSADDYAVELGLKAKGLTPLALCAVGYRSAEDAYQHKIKVRRTDLFNI